MVHEQKSDGSCCAKRHSRAPTQHPCGGSEEFDAPHMAKTTRTGLRTQQHSQIQAFQATSSEQLRISFQENIPGTTRPLHHPRRRGRVQSQIFLFFLSDANFLFRILGICNPGKTVALPGPFSFCPEFRCEVSV